MHFGPKGGDIVQKYKKIQIEFVPEKPKPRFTFKATILKLIQMVVMHATITIIINWTSPIY